ncbi:MAG TPA: O-antigen ligase family protein [Solirubrobacteraceae bacterium]
MNPRARAFELLPSSILAAAAILGVIAALQPLIAIAAVGGIVLAYVVFNDLAMGFAVLAFLSFLETLPTSGSLSLAKGAGLLIAVAWLANFSASEGSRRDFFAEHGLLTWVLILFFGWAIVSLLWATSVSIGVEALTRYGPNILLLPIAYTAIRNRRDIGLVVGAIVFGAMIAAAFGILQPPDANLIAESSRASGTVGDPNELAAFLLVGLALGAGVALGKGRAPAIRFAAFVAVPMCAAGIFLSLSRGGLVALACMLLAGTVFAGRWRVALTAVLVAVALGGVLYFTELASLPARERVTSVNGGTGRSDIWKLGLRMVRAHPITGVGVGNFPVVSPNYALQPGALQRADLIFSTAPKVTHNTYLEVMSELGIPGFLLFMGVIVSCLFCSLRAARIWSARGDPSMEALARSVFLGLFGMLVADFFISDMFSKLLWVMLAIGPALLAVARSEQAEAEAEHAPAGRGELALAA